MGVHGDLILCGITNQTLVLGEGDIRWSCAVSLVVCNDFYTIILPYSNTTVQEDMSAMSVMKVGVLTSRLCQGQYQ